MGLFETRISSRFIPGNEEFVRVMALKSMHIRDRVERLREGLVSMA